MADNDPAASQPEVELGHISPEEPQGLVEEKDVTVAGYKEQEDQPLNVSGEEEPKEDTSASEQMPAPDGEVEEDTGMSTEVASSITAHWSNGCFCAAVVTAPEQVVNPRPPADGTTEGLGQPPPESSSPETTSNVASTIAAPTPAKRFTSMNINKKFFAKTAASPSSSSSTAAPKTPSLSSTGMKALGSRRSFRLLILAE
jgi:hypothetical protein